MGNDLPHKLIPENPDSPEFLEYCNSVHLESMNEPSFIEKSKNEDFHAYRFLWLRSFHQPICIRLEINTDGSAQLVIKMPWGYGIFYSGELATGKSYKISKNAAQTFLGYLKKADFWNLKTKEEAKGLDGANWIIEGKPADSTLSGVAEQTAKYIRHFPENIPHISSPLPFAYESTGIITYFRDDRDPEPLSRCLYSFHKPEILLEWVGQSATLRSRLQQLPPLITDGLRDCQIEAITNLDPSFKEARPRALI
jgi:hypothetical protein